MNDKAEEEEVKGESYDYSNDFHLLSRTEKRGLVKNAKTPFETSKGKCYTCRCGICPRSA
jgi:hypothetical protein